MLKCVLNIAAYVPLNPKHETFLVHPTPFEQPILSSKDTLLTSPIGTKSQRNKQ